MTVSTLKDGFKRVLANSARFFDIKWGYLGIVSLPLVVAVGAYLKTIITPILLILAVCAIAILIVLNRIKVKEYPICLFAMSLGLLWQTTMLGHYVVGSDIQAELFLANRALGQGWDFNFLHISNTSIVIGLIAPFLARILDTDMVWVFKVVLPLLFSFTPLLLYYAFKRQIGDIKAYFATLFFMIVPVFSLEIVAIAKSQIAELCFAGIILLMTSGIRYRYKTMGILLLGVAATLCHYTIGLIVAGYLICILAVSIVNKGIRLNILKNSKLPVWVLVVVLVTMLSLGYFYYAKASNGIIITALSSILGWTRTVPEQLVDYTVRSGAIGYLNEQPLLVKAAIGLDFTQVSVWGKLFRIVQYLTQVLIIVGTAYLLFRHKQYKFTTEFIGGIFGSFVLLAICIFVPKFSALINMTRFYHLSLFFLAPMLVVGIDCIVRKWDKLKLYVAATLLIIYFVFTSGLVFEITKSNTVASLETPYSLALSGDRLGLVGIYSQDDIKCARWLAEESNPNLMIAADYNGLSLLQSFMYVVPRIIPTPRSNPIDLFNVPSDTYVFMTSWNAKNGKVVIAVDAGLRLLKDIPSGLQDNEIAYRSGSSAVYLVR